MIYAILGLIIVMAAALATAYGERTKRIASDQKHEVEIKTYENVKDFWLRRYEESQQEAIVLAAQLVQLGTVPTPKYAMPLPDPDDGAEYSYDSTGLVVDKLDPREMPYG